MQLPEVGSIQALHFLLSFRAYLSLDAYACVLKQAPDATGTEWPEKLAGYHTCNLTLLRIFAVFVPLRACLSH